MLYYTYLCSIDNYMRQNKLDILLKQDRKFFHTADLAVLWDITNKHTLHTAISRFLKQRILFSIHRGLYSVLPLENLDEIQLGASILHRYCYLSTETVLVQQGIIFQAIYKITFVSDISKTFIIAGKEILSRKAHPRFLHNTTGIYQRDDGILCADVSRAIADMLYFQPNYLFDAASTIDWDKVKAVQKEIGYL